MCMFDDGDAPRFCNVVLRKARKVHKCSECSREISRGEKYQHTSGMWDGFIDTVKTCIHCIVIQDWLVKECGGYVYHAIIEDAREHVEEYGVRHYGFGLPRLIVMAENQWRRKGALVPVPAIPRTTQEALAPGCGDGVG